MIVMRDQYAWMAERQEECLAFQPGKRLEDKQEGACLGLGWDRLRKSLSDQVAKSGLV